MASSQVEIAATSSSPFGRGSYSFPNDKSRGIDFTDLWVHHPQWQTKTTTTTAANINECDDHDVDNSSSIHNKTAADKWARAREMVFSVDHAKQQQSAEEVSNLLGGGVSSLVQKWRGFESKLSNNNSCRTITISTTTTTNTSSLLMRSFQQEQDIINNNNNNNNIADPPSPTPTPTPSPSLDDYSFVGDCWESSAADHDRTSCPVPSSSETAERLRVADIIRKLTDNNNEAHSPPSPPPPPPPPRPIIIRTTTSSLLDQSALRCHHHVVMNSPRIRGRQAFNDLLMQMEHDRHKEIEGLVARKPVSKFSHRGRIQALLRFRFLHRGMEAKEGCRPSNGSKSSCQMQKAIEPPVMHIRERVVVNPSTTQKGGSSSSVPFGIGCCCCCHKENTFCTCTAQNYAYAANQQGNHDDNRYTDSKSTTTATPPGVVVLVKTENSSQGSSVTTSKQQLDVSHNKVKEEEDKQENINVRLLHDSPFNSTSIIRQETNNNHSFLTKSAWKGAATTNFHNTAAAIIINSGEKIEPHHSNNIETSTSTVHIKEKAETTFHHRVTESNYDHPTAGDCEEPPSNYHHKEEPAAASSNLQQHLVDTTTSMYSWVSDDDVSNPELQSDDHNQQQQGSNREYWIDEVSRPRSDWEDLRRARYQEMLDPFLDNNEEIRVLLGRRSVSTFLSSGLREQIDRVVISRGPKTDQEINDQTQEEKHEGRLPEHVVVSDIKQEEGEDYMSDEASGSSVGQHYNESGDYTDRIMSSLPESWPMQNQGHESSDYSYQQFASPCTQQSSSNYYSHDNRQPKSSAHPTIDMEVMIYDLRGHMEQIHQEMSELRKLIKCCMEDMQIKLQRSIKKEVSTALQYHSSETKNGRRNAVKKVTTRCCVCCKMQVDSLLYRCGHMCTCFKCGHKLMHWSSSGKCPICRAPILDVVRLHPNIL